MPTPFPQMRRGRRRFRPSTRSPRQHGTTPRSLARPPTRTLSKATPGSRSGGRTVTSTLTGMLPPVSVLPLNNNRMAGPLDSMRFATRAKGPPAGPRHVRRSKRNQTTTSPPPHPKRGISQAAAAMPKRRTPATATPRRSSAAASPKRPTPATAAPQRCWVGAMPTTPNPTLATAPP